MLILSGLIWQEGMERQIQLPTGVISGWCAPEFEALLAAFVENFTDRGELGASLALVQGDQVLVDLTGGFVDQGRQKPWAPDTLCVVHSCTKAATALCLHLLIDQGRVALTDPVSRYWPEYDQAGKGDTQVAMLLNHTSGLPALNTPLKPGAFLDWDFMTETLAKAAPLWTPGCEHGYQMTTFGWLVGELVRRISGQSLGAFFRQWIAEPLGTDFWIGLPSSEHHRVAKLARFKPQRGMAPAAFTQHLIKDPESIPAKAYFNTGGFKADAPESYLAEFGAGGGLTNARGLAKMYAPLAQQGATRDKQFMSPDQVQVMAETAVRGGIDRTLMMPTHFSAGFMKTMNNLDRPGGALESLIFGPKAFGHAGAGGSLGFAEPELGLSFGYVMNQMGAGILLNERGQTLVDALYQSQGYRHARLGDYRR